MYTFLCWVRPTHVQMCTVCSLHSCVCVLCMCSVYVSGYMGICASIIHTAFAQFLVAHIAHCELQFIIQIQHFLHSWPRSTRPKHPTVKLLLILLRTYMPSTSLLRPRLHTFSLNAQDQFFFNSNVAMSLYDIMWIQIETVGSHMQTPPSHKSHNNPPFHYCIHVRDQLPRVIRNWDKIYGLELPHHCTIYMCSLSHTHVHIYTAQ